MVFQFANDIRAGKKVCYTLSRCPHRLAAKDATLSRWISRVRIPLGAPQHLSRSRRVFRLGLFSFRHMCAKPVRQMCAKSAENRPAAHREGNGEGPACTGSGPAAGLSIAPPVPSATVLLAPLLPVCLAFCSPLGYPSGVRPSATPWLPSVCAFARPLGCPLAHRRGPPRTRADYPAKAKGGPLPHGTARPSALDIPLCVRPRPRRISRALARWRRHP